MSDGMVKSLVDVLIITFNESANIGYCLRSLAGWPGKVWVVDSGSTDGTVQIAKEHGAEVVHHDWEGYAFQRNWALDNLAMDSEWVLVLDADESVPPDLRQMIEQITSKPASETRENGFFLNRLSFFCGQPIRHCGYYPSWHLRLFKRELGRYEKRLVHEHLILPDPTGYLKPPLQHRDRRSLEHYYGKHNRYSTLEAEQQLLELTGRIEPGEANVSPDTRRRRWLKSHLTLSVPFISLWRFLYMYVFRLGILDGRAGYNFCTFIAHYDGMVAMKLRTLYREHLAGRPLEELITSNRGPTSGLAIPEGELADHVQPEAAAAPPAIRTGPRHQTAFFDITRVSPPPTDAQEALCRPGLRRLITLPVNPGQVSGYHKAVAADVERLKLNDQDTVVIYWQSNDAGISNARLIPRFARYSWRRLVRGLRLRISTEVSVHQLRPHLNRNEHFDVIFCGDIAFYRALRKLYPHHLLYVRLHNLFSLADSRRRFLRRRTDWVFRFNMFMFSRLEKLITRDPNTHVIFISQQERAFFHMHVRDRPTDTWLIRPPQTRPATAPTQMKLIWFGSMATHTKPSVSYFIRHVFAPLRSRHPGFELHMWGWGTEVFHNPDKGILGHGFYEGEDLPERGEGLFVVPDLLGGGVKIKVGDLMHAGAAFIATPFGIEGNDIPPSPHIMVADIDNWVETIEAYFRSLNLSP